MTSQDENQYRRAAEDCLEQLDWCIGYLHGIRKTKVAAVLPKNRGYIKRSIMREAQAPMPSEVTNES
jgi:hypothetical protein